MTNIRINNHLLIKYVILMTLVYINTVNIFYVFFYNVSNAEFFITVFPATKDLIIIVILFYVYLSIFYKGNLSIKKNLAPLYLILLILGLYLALQFFISPAPLSYKAYNLRMISMFFITLLAFMHINISVHDLRFIKQLLVIISILIVVFGFIEYFLPAYFWEDIIGMKKFSAARFLGGTKVDRIYSSDLIFLIGKEVRRMMSFFAEPTTLGSFITFAFSYFSFAKTDIPFRKFLLVTLFISGLLVFSKIFLVSIFIVFAYKWVIKKPKFYPLVIFTSGLYFLSRYLYIVVGKIHGSLAHFFGFYTGINLLVKHPFGFGLGMGGNRGFLNQRIEMGEFGGESGLGNLTAQLGIIGLLYLFAILLIMWYNRKMFYKTNNQEYLGIFVALFNFIINFYLSAASLGFSGNIMFFIFAGIYINPRISGFLNGTQYGY